MRSPLLYDAVMAPFERTVLGRMRALAFGSARGRVLEIGGGTGCTLAHYRDVASVTLTDARFGMLRRARSRMQAVTFPVHPAVSAAGALPFGPATFDVVVVSLAFCTIPEPAKAFAEIRRVLRPDGELRMLEHVRVERPSTARLQDFLTPGWRRISGGCRLNRPTIETAQRCGFEPVEVRYEMGGWLAIARMKPVR